MRGVNVMFTAFLNGIRTLLDFARVRLFLFRPTQFIVPNRKIRDKGQFWYFGFNFSSPCENWRNLYYLFLCPLIINIPFRNAGCG